MFLDIFSFFCFSDMVVKSITTPKEVNIATQPLSECLDVGTSADQGRREDYV